MEEILEEKLDLTGGAPTPYEVTFFVPALDEERHVGDTLDTIREAIRSTGRSAEILVFDDHSTDRTAERVREWAARNPGVPLRLVRRAKRMGLARNYVDGAFIGRGRYYKQVGADDSEPVGMICDIVARLGEADMIVPYLRRDPRSPGRRVLSRLFTAIINAASGRRLRYYNGTAAHLRANVMRWHSDTYGFAFQAELITRLIQEGASWIEVPVEAVEQPGRRSRAIQFHNVLSVGHSVLQILLRRLRHFLFRV